MLILIAAPFKVSAKTEGKTSFAIAPGGEVFLLIPSEEKKIHHFNGKGIPVRRFGGEGPGDGELLAPVDMKYWDGNLYVLDLFGPQIKVFSPGGKQILSFGKNLPMDQQMKSPVMMRIRHDPDEEKDFIYVLDMGKNLVMIYTVDGKFVDGFSLPLDYDKYFRWITSFNVDDLGNLWFVSDSTDDVSLRHVLVFDKGGAFVKELSMSKIGGFGNLTDIITQAEGRFILVDSSVGGSNQSYSGALLMFDEKGDVVEKKEICDKKTLKFHTPQRISIVQDSIYVLTNDDMLLRLDMDFNVLASWSLK